MSRAAVAADGSTTTARNDVTATVGPAAPDHTSFDQVLLHAAEARVEQLDSED